MRAAKPANEYPLCLAPRFQNQRSAVARARLIKIVHRLDGSYPAKIALVIDNESGWRQKSVLRGDFSSGEEQLTLLRSLPHGHVAAALGTLRKLKLDRVLSQGGRQPARKVSLSIAMIVARLLDPVSKLATARLLDAETASCSLGAVLGFTAVD